VSHGRDHSEAVACVGHVQIRDENVKARGGNAFQSFRYAAHSDYLEPLGLERFARHVQYNFIVIHQENSMDCLSFD
jgi:hypothetical protein